MKKRPFLILIATLLCCTTALGRAEENGSRGIFYRIVGGKNEMVVLGSIHIGSKAMYPMSDAILTALERADTLVFECDTESEEAVQATAMLTTYSGGDTLSDHIEPELRAKLTRTARKLKISDRTLEKMKPWAVASVLSAQIASAQMENESSAEGYALGVERMVKEKAGEKPYLYLETAEEQLLIMDGFSAELQAYLVDSGCESVLNPTEETQQTTEWPKWWADGNAQAFADSYLTSFAEEPQQELAQEYHEALYIRRDTRMAQRLAELLESEEEHSYFVTIGLMHLVLPEEGVLFQLQQMGYQVQGEMLHP